VVSQGDLWIVSIEGDKERPVLVVSRNEVIPVIQRVVVAPVTSTLRSLPTNISVGPDEGLRHESVASFDNLTTVPKALLTRRLGSLGAMSRYKICAALQAMADC
jgi:mRNA interferase MazF